MDSSTMDLSQLTRPALLCQCSQCLSSLAVLENEWVKLSNSYSVVSGWLSIQLHRISISPEKKQIPQSSELSLIRGRIIQEIGCKLCQQKLGVLCALDNGPNIFWKLSKVSLLEIVTMRTVEPTFKDGDGVLENVLLPKSKSFGFMADGTASHAGALVATNPDEIDNYDISVEHQMQRQGLSLDHISSSVSTLHDTMYELKNAFTSMRIELNSPSRFSNGHELANSDFNMVTTVLKELKSKADEIEKLKLELEALKFRNRYVEEHSARQTLPTLTVEAPLPEVATPGLLRRSRKRPFPFPDHYQGGRQRPVADSFDDDGDEEDSMIDFSLGEPNMPSVKIPLKDSGRIAEPVRDSPSLRSPGLQIEVGHSTNQTPQSLSLEEPTPKRPRLSSSGNSSSNKRPRGRPRLSVSKTTQPDQTWNPKPKPLNEQNGNHPLSIPNDHQKTLEKPTRSSSLRSRSRAPSLNSRNRMSTDKYETNTDKTQQDQNTPSEPTSQPVIELDKETPHIEINGSHANDGTETKSAIDKKRRAQNAKRDSMAKLAMQREEAMETEEVR